MGVLVRKDGRILCAARHERLDDDLDINDGVLYWLAVEKKVLVTEPMHCGGGLGGHSTHGQWWIKGEEPDEAIIDDFYYA